MYVKELRLENYRNIKSARIEFSKGINILYGENANGKTNVIEGIFMFAGGKSFRAKNNADVINEKSAGYTASLVGYSAVKRRDEKMTIEADRDKFRKYAINGVQLKKISEFIGSFRAVLFTPDHLSLVKGTPDVRRRFADIAISQLKPVYMSYLSEYIKILGNRNRLLKEIKTGRLDLRSSGAELEVWTEHMAKYAAAVTKYRNDYSTRLSQSAPEFYAGLSGGRETLSVKYTTCLEKLGVKIAVQPCGLDEIEEMYSGLYKKGGKDELKFGSTLFGPHRDDIYIAIDGKSAKNFASQGQQRSAVLALKLAEGDISRDMGGEYPVFLLDDILSELDRGRQSYLLGSLENRQVIITCCSRDLFAGFDFGGGETGIFEVRGGEISKSGMI